MTIEEIKNQLEELIKDRESFMVGDYDKDIYDCDKEALEFAVKAVEKQVPKKVKREFATEGGCITCFETDVCPTCGDDFYIDDLGQTMYYSFCPDCGQALDWTDDDELDKVQRKDAGKW